jgi:translation initiation factor 2B subunit (eIF-2B alpha/beta/delta family)
MFGRFMSSKSFNDNISGASEIFHRAALFLIEQLRDPAESENDRERILSIAGHILSKQPRMAPLYHLLNLTLDSWNKYRDDTDGREKVIQQIENFASREKRAGKHIARHLLLSLHQKTIGVYSRSSVILNALLCARKQDIDFRVYITEARPNLEGQKTAMELANAGIDTTLVVDAALAHVVQQSDLLCVGADRISETVAINKTGTKALALLAQQVNKPLYIISSEIKFLPDKINMQEEHNHPASEISPEQKENLHYWNKYFEEIPLTLFSGVISESGMLSMDNVRKKIKNLNMQALQPLLQQ